MASSSTAELKNQNEITRKRLEKELNEWLVNPPDGFNHKAAVNHRRWIIGVKGAQGTLYANELYNLQVDFPENYPVQPPQFIFLDPAPLHPHIYSDGHIRSNILYNWWSPDLTVRSVCVSILYLLSTSTAKQLPEDNDEHIKRAADPPKDTR